MSRLADRPLLMGILNVTPDSFSDGGRYFAPQVAIEAGLRMIEEGADILDIGGESTRPGSERVDEEEELRRVMPVLEGLAGAGVSLSIDTSKPAVAKAALEAGAEIVNDVRALTEPGMLRLCAEQECTVCLMHMQGEPKTMQVAPRYRDVVGEVLGFLQDRAARAVEGGIAADKIWIDPGIGFGKTTDHNLTLLRHLDRFTGLEWPVLIGVSRKAFIGKVLGSEMQPLSLYDRLDGTLALQVLAHLRGATVIRTHDVLAARRAIDMIAAVSG